MTERFERLEEELGPKGLPLLIMVVAFLLYLVVRFLVSGMAPHY